MKTIEQEIQQKEFKSPIQRVHINLLFTASILENRSSQSLKPFGISPQQFNILRILKGKDPESISLKDIACKMLDQNSNASRLVDKLLEKGLVKRTNCIEDRRRIDIVLTEDGKALLEEANKKIEEFHQIANVFSVSDANLLNDLLNKYRNAYIN
jgi:DNA-binding MarR family transcriptional regulator